PRRPPRALRAGRPPRPALRRRGLRPGALLAPPLYVRGPARLRLPPGRCPRAGAGGRRGPGLPPGRPEPAPVPAPRRPGRRARGRGRHGPGHAGRLRVPARGERDAGAEAGPAVRKVVQMLSVSLDGFIEGAEGELDWHMVDDEVHRPFNEVLAAMGAF